MVDERLAAAETRLAQIETEMGKVKNDIHSMKNSMQAASGDVRQLKDSVQKIEEQNADILYFVTGANTVFGFAKKHWKQAIIFGAGIMTAAGVGNPKVNAFITTFFGV
jgi:hypothetical protein